MTPDAVQLTPRFDVVRLLADWEAVASVTQHPQPGQYHDGGWRGVSLVAPGGLATWAGACLPIGLRPAKTPLLKRTPQFEQLLDSLSCTVESARLLTLLPGETIRPHRDNLTSLRSGVARLHVPITTHSDVEFVVGGVRYTLEAGSMWYANFAKPHSVHNPTNTPRVHLVVDVIVNERLLRFFSPAYLQQLAGSEVFLPSPELPPSALKLPAPSRRFELAPALRSEVVALRKFANAAAVGRQARFAAGPPGTEEGRTVSFGSPEDSLVLHLDGEPYAALAPISAKSFRMFGFLPCITGHIDEDQVSVFYKTRLIGRCRSLA